MSTSQFVKEAAAKRERLVFSFKVVEAPRLVAKGTYELSLAKPTDFVFRAGQSMKFYPRDPDGASFTIVSAPEDDVLVFAFRDSDSPLKKRMRELKTGDAVPIRDVKREGDTFHYPEDTEANVPVVMIAGGIGVTPFVSMLRHAAHTRDTRSFTLITANPTPEHASYEREISACADAGVQLSRSQFYTAATGTSAPPRRFARSDLAPHWREPRPIFYIAGPLLMVEETVTLLLDIGVPRDRIRDKAFKGYTGADDVVR